MSKDAIQHARDQQQRRDSYRLKDDISDQIDVCARSIERGGRSRLLTVFEVLVNGRDGDRDGLIPNIRVYGEESWAEYDYMLREETNWYWDSFNTFLERSGAIRDTLKSAPSGTQRYMKARVVVERTLATVTEIAEYEDVIMDEYASKVDAVGFSTKVGEHLQDAELDIGNPVKIITDRSGAVKSLHTGGTGQGKSVGVEREAEDYYLQNFEEGRDYKIMDLVGLRDGENWFYDIPQQDPDLQTPREEMGLPDELEAEDVDVDIFVPLTPNLSEQQLPFDVEREEFIVRPFTIPASEIRQELLISILTTKLTEQQKGAVRNAYEELDHRRDDWALKDLAAMIKAQEDVPPEKRQTIVTTLQNLQRRGFIRTRDDPYTLDWRELFTTPETISVFSQAVMPNKPVPRLITVGYLTHTIKKSRETMHGVPEVVLMMRELWKVAPHSKRQHFDQQAAELQESIGQMFAGLFRENRHSGVHLLADTQQVSDLLKPVREMFNRYVVYHTNKNQVRSIFDWTANDKWKVFYNTLTPNPGEASVVGMVEPALEERNIEFVGPVRYAPPSHHHRIERIDSNGWRARTKYLEHEELRKPADVGIDWDAEEPDDLKVESEGEGEVDPEVKPVKAFVSECVEYEKGAQVIRDELKRAFNAFAQDHGLDGWDFNEKGVQRRFGKRLHGIVDGELGRAMIDGERTYENLRLTHRGEEYLRSEWAGLEPSSEPVSA